MARRTGKELQDALRAVGALSSADGPTTTPQEEAVCLRLVQVPEGGEAVVDGVRVRRGGGPDRFLFRVVEPWSSRRLSRLGPIRPVARRILEVRLLAAWREAGGG